MITLRSATRVRRARALACAAVPPRAAVLLIGDEILSGRTKDANLSCLAATLFEWGVPLTRAVVAPDDVADIGATALDLQERVGASGLVFTSGGIGPTHDDLTYEALAAAFGVPLHVHATPDGS